MNDFLVLASCAAGALSLFDALFTIRRLEKYGPEIELNPVIRYLLARGWDVAIATSTALLIPASLILLGLAFFNLDHAAGVYAGMRGMLTWQQLASMRLEREFDKLRAAAQGAPPSARPTPSPEDISTKEPQ